MEVSTSFLKDGNYGEFIEILNNSNTDYIHYDVMDGKFVDNKNLSLKELEKYIKMSEKKIDVHLMVKDPKKYIDVLSTFNINNITIHREIKNYEEMIDLIRLYGIRAGIAVNPETDINEIYGLLDKVDIVLIMGVHPGKSGQKFIKEVSNKIPLLKEEINKRGLNTKIEVDGGVCDEVFYLVKDVDILVSASYVLDNLDNIEKIKNINKLEI